MTRTPFILLAALAAVLTLGACGGGNNNNNAGTPGGNEDKAFEGALKFSKCMRDHGVDVPDPKRTSGGGIMMTGPKGGGGGPGKRVDDPKMKAASDACDKYLQGGGGTPPSAAEMAKQRDTFVGYARCMRGKGIEMPDPKVNGNGIQMMLGKGARPDSPVFKAADKACHPLLAAVERTMGGPKEHKP